MQNAASPFNDAIGQRKIEREIAEPNGLDKYAPLLVHAYQHWDEIQWGIRERNTPKVITTPRDIEDVMAVMLRNVLENGKNAALKLGDPDSLTRVFPHHDYLAAFKALAQEGNVRLSENGTAAAFTTPQLARIIHKAEVHKGHMEVAAAKARQTLAAGSSGALLEANA